jgi:alkanesulfonate monooxygenase SsuD/methylene tetrahydromethanopterin reductase-like flavin-dependent oxidoreductase (luciferase family)
MADLRLGVLILPEHRWPGAAGRWRRAEDLGFDHAWTYDHVAWRDLRDSTWFASVPTLTAAAMTTRRIRLGTLVASPNFRHPVPFARELVTLDDITGGRLTVGLGAGGQGWDATVLGQEPWSLDERAERFAEFVGLLDRLLRHPETTYRGRYWSADEARTYPGCVQQPRVPFAVAATGPRSMRVAAIHGSTWVTNGDRAHEGAPLPPSEGAQVVAQQMARFEEVCAAAGRDAATIDRLVLTGARLDSGLQSRAAFDEVRSAYAEVGVTDLVVHWPRASEPYAGDESILEEIVG